MHKLLIVDDEPEILNGLSQYFPWREVGFSVVKIAENGKQAYDYLLEYQVDVILCDIKMPVMNGLELLERLRKGHASIRFIFLSGYMDFDMMRKAIVLGASDYLAKPTNYEELFEVFRRVNGELNEEKSNMAGNDDPGNTDASSQADPIRYVDEKFIFNEEVIRKVKAYIEEKYSTANLEKAAELVHMNPHYLSKFFKDKTGQNFSEYAIEVKMKAALELLKDIKLRTYEVGQMVGYADHKNFAKMFRKFYGISPSEFRRGQAVEQNP